jgi:hypothetical protein
MPAPKTRPAAKRGSKSRTDVLPDDHTPSEAVAHAIRTEFVDLTPSVNRILNAGLAEPGQLQAITLFRDSLGVPGDPNRTPAHAIEAGRKIDERSTH